MTATDAQVFARFAQCFGSVDETTWNEAISETAWNEFLDDVRILLQGMRRLTNDVIPANELTRTEPFSEFLTEPEVRALFHPPTFQEKKSFANRYFTGGIPGAVLPVESLHAGKAARGTAGSGAANGTGNQKGFYFGDSARYMKDLMTSLGASAPASFAACPDHLSLELDLLSLMIDEGMDDEARQFLQERFAWLTDFRAKILDIGADAHFYLALIDALIGIREQQASVAALG